MSALIARQAKAAKVTFDRELCTLVNGKPFFPLGLYPGAPPGLKTPEGEDGLAEMAAAGINMMLLPSPGGTWDPEREASFALHMEAASKAGVLAVVHLHQLIELSADHPERAEQLRQVVTKWRAHPALGIWNSRDEPEWGKVPPEPLKAGYDLVRKLDPDHPVWINHAPRGTVPSLRRYNAACDLTGCDIYPVSVPMGRHSDRPNKGLSMTGDFTQLMRKVAGPNKPVWMILQVNYSGARAPHPTVFPDFRQERYMVYQAIINGATGIFFYGMPYGLTGADAEAKWNWTFWREVLKPLLAEIGPKSELYRVFLSPTSKRKIKVTGATDVELLCKEMGGYLYFLVAKREGAASEVRFSNVPDGRVTVMFEKRYLQSKNKSFGDRFGPNDVHVYRVKLPSKS